MRRALPIIALAAALSGCGGGDGDQPASVPPPITKEPEPLSPQQAQPGAPVASSTLVRIPNTAAARRRLGYVNDAALASADLPLAREQVIDAVLGDGARPDRILVGSRRVAPGDDAPQTSAITPLAQSTVQSCLGDTVAQTILGPRTMGFNAALGAGLISTDGRPLRLRVCGAPHLARDNHATEDKLRRAFGSGATVGVGESGERELVSGTTSVRALPEREVLGILAGGAELRALGWR